MKLPSENAAECICKSFLWKQALWLGTTFQWHPTGEKPPIMGLMFGNSDKGADLFQLWVDAVGNDDPNDDLRVAIIEGDVPGQTAGYTVRLSPTLNEYLVDGDQGYMDIGQVVRMHPQLGNPGQPDMLARFKREYDRHGEFMLAGTVERDGQYYMNIEQGIIKRELVVRQVSDIGEDEPDYRALRECDDAKILEKAQAEFQRALADQLNQTSRF